MTSVMPKFQHNTTPATEAEKKSALKKIIKARTALVLEHPFVGTIALNLPYKIDETVPTAATNGKDIKFNPHFVNELTDEEVKFLVAHECFHPMLEHNFRRNERDPRKWNQAGDYIINQLLTDEGIGKMPEGGLQDKGLYDAASGVTDNVYNMLPDSDEGDGRDPLDDCQDGGDTPADKTQQAAEWKVRVAQAAQSAKMMGKMSEGLARLVSEVLQPRVDWRDVMHKFIEKCRSDVRSWSRPNRRFIAQDMYLPSRSGERLGEIVYAVDCSGSITEQIINQFASEIRKCKEDMNPAKIHVVYFDSEVSHYESYEADDDLDIKPHGGGGTAFSPVFAYIQEHGIEPVACIFLTDLCCDDFGDVPDYPVLWVSTDPGTAPFGEIVVM
jgi:predicted metal-dependent peptidase